MVSSCLKYFVNSFFFVTHALLMSKRKNSLPSILQINVFILFYFIISYFILFYFILFYFANVLSFKVES